VFVLKPGNEGLNFLPRNFGQGLNPTFKGVRIHNCRPNHGMTGTGGSTVSGQLDNLISEFLWVWTQLISVGSKIKKRPPDRGRSTPFLAPASSTA